MKSYESIFKLAAKRKGGRDALEALLSKPKSTRTLARRSDDEWLAAFARCIFASGFRWKVVDAKWPEIEEALHGFQVGRVAFIDEAELGALVEDRRVIRHRAKLEAIRDNARWLLTVAKQDGSFAKRVATWSDDDTVGLWAWLKRDGFRLGGNTGPRALRLVGKDTFVLTPSVSAALQTFAVVDKAPTSKRDLAKVQDAFNAWRAESGRSHTEISWTLAYAVPS